MDSKTNLPLLYLKDNKKQLWDKFEAMYPDGIKRASFMARLTNGRYVYREDLGGLCNICNEYEYEVFDTLINIIQLNIKEKETKVNILLQSTLHKCTPLGTGHKGAFREGVHL